MLLLRCILLLRLKIHSFSSSPNVKFLGACKPMQIAQLVSLNIKTSNIKFVFFLSTTRIRLLSSNILQPCENNTCFKRPTKNHIWGTINLAFHVFIDNIIINSKKGIDTLWHMFDQNVYIKYGSFFIMDKKQKKFRYKQLNFVRDC